MSCFKDREAKIVWRELDTIRSLKGILEKIDNGVVYLHRRDGDWLINWDNIIKIEILKGEACDEQTLC